MEQQNKQPLTDAEKIIAKHLEDGLSRDEIAVAQVCSIHTIHTHCRRMFRKYKVNNVTGLLKRLREKS